MQDAAQYCFTNESFFRTLEKLRLIVLLKRQSLKLKKNITEKH